MTNGHNIPPDNLCLSEKLLREYAEKLTKLPPNLRIYLIQ